MATAEIKTEYTPEDLLTMPDGNRFELVDGQLVEKQMSFWSSYVAGRIHHRLTLFADERKIGWVLPEGATYQCFPDAPNRVRKPDTSFIRYERVSEEQAHQEGHVHIVPDLVVEVISPTDNYYDVDAKLYEYLQAGVKVVWIINPDLRTAHLHRSDGSAITIHEQQELTAEDLLPGFRCRLGDLFQPPPRNA